MKCYLWLNCRLEYVHLSLSPPPPHPSFPSPSSSFLRAGFTLVPVILLPFVSVGLFAIECCFLLHPHRSRLLLPSPPLLSLTHSFTLGPNYEIASNKYMYFFSCEGGKNLVLHSFFFFFDGRLNSRLKEVLFSEVPLQIGVVAGTGDFLGAVIVSH